MKYHGRPPNDDNRLKPGIHHVQLDRVQELDSGDYLAVLGNESGECVVNINPDLREKKHAWRFWRLAGAFDYPDPAYWSLDPDKRPERDWDPWDDLHEIKARKTECIVVISERQWNGKTLANVDEMKSIARHGDAATTRDLDTQVPF